MSKDFHADPFDEGTLEKLSLLRTYLDEWIPVFIAADRPRHRTVNIFDFFAGPGMDADGNRGSPLLILDALLQYTGLIREKGLRVNAVFNDTAQWKVRELERHLNSNYLKEDAVHVTLSRLPFSEALHKFRPWMNDSANLVFLDQTGVKQITDDIFNTLITIPTTDFIFFISSSFIGRFSEHPNFQKYLNISRDAIRSMPYFHIHRAVIAYYRSRIPIGQRLYIGGFSLKKGRNIYGLIFGSHHPLGMEKFLKSCWKVDPDRGDANYDIDGDGIDHAQPFLLNFLAPRKMNAFEEHLRSGILSRRLKSDGDVYLFTLEEGCLPEHARHIMRKLVDEGRIQCRYRVSREGWREPRPIEVM